jgi:hypothetical protein
MRRLLVFLLLLSTPTLADICSTATTTPTTIKVSMRLQSDSTIVAMVAASGTVLIQNTISTGSLNSSFEIWATPDGVTWCKEFGPQSFVLPTAVSAYTSSTPMYTNPVARSVSSTPSNMLHAGSCGLNVVVMYSNTATSTWDQPQ